MGHFLSVLIEMNDKKIRTLADRKAGAQGYRKIIGGSLYYLWD
jgi:hypothetical protein